MEFSEDYPNKPPTVKFLSKMFHPNIYADGGICLDILQNRFTWYTLIMLSQWTLMQLRRNLISHFFCRWSPTYDVSAILTSIQSLLSDPNPNSPANSMAAQLFKENRREYEKRVKACVEQSWCDDWNEYSLHQWNICHQQPNHIKIVVWINLAAINDKMKL